MIQAIFTSGSSVENFTYLRLSDIATIDLTVRPLISITSQQSKKVLNFMPTTITTSTPNRYHKMNYFMNGEGTGALPLFGIIVLGDTDYPLGLYDVTIYKNTGNANLDPSGLTTVLYTGLLNLTSSVATTQYTEYTTNDSDTESVYLTI
tara:strand:- start:37 stop:483 length:447 start_codon:yes stop_codon:yes gene_type:complete